MHSTGQPSQMLWQPSYPLTLHPDECFNDFAIPCGAPFIDAVTNTYESQDTDCGISYHNQHNADFLAAQEYIPAAGIPGPFQRARLRQPEPELLLMSDVATAAIEATHTEKTLQNRNSNANGNENAFISWLYPLNTGSPAQSFVESEVPWRSNATLDTELRGLQNSVGAKNMTQFERQFMPIDEEDKEPVVENQDGDACKPPSAGSRSSQALSTIRTSARNRVSSSRQIASVPGSSTATCRSTGYRKKLTIEQKRSNHIRHEKTRRGRIRDGFNDLTELVPELRGGTWSRSKILFKSVEWLQTLVERNETLQKQLDALGSTEDHQ